MANTNNILGVSSFELGAPGDGVMGVSLTNYPDVEVGSVNIEGSQANEQTIPTENSDAYITINGEATPSSVTARLYGVTPTQMVELAGGEVNGTDGLWEAPKTIPNIYLSFRMKGQPINGKVGVLEMAYAKVTARLQGTVTKNGLPAVDVTLTANTPVSAAQVEGPPLRFGVEDAA
ncbi:hypothetical protein [Aestuariibaculum marinum]|uniref:Phage tail protein n=1 Tax=Aestuariibaculum marinum TaxID=2683592 RepID=A0A8J6U6C8_9FLAO|nr:hypothetical protein [Aestuariibaculum marinum]MBD0822641.1 hypothetical protein [Aestuariibaculum marinum]